MNQTYKNQVALLLNILPEVAKEKSFAMHGGTAINLFVRDMPRLSVDIDLTYVNIEDRATTLQNIGTALQKIKSSINTAFPRLKVQHLQEKGKLLISSETAVIKLEVNLVARGLIAEAVFMPLCSHAQREFNAFAEVQLVSLGQLYGGKICAALDRQHPRDLFDVRYLLSKIGITDEIKKGFLYSLLSSDRPINELLAPNLSDQSAVFENHFSGMSLEAFSYDNYEQTREDLIEAINKSLNEKDKEFILSFNKTAPDWTLYDFSEFPSIRWKMQNLEILKRKDKIKFSHQLDMLKRVLAL